MSRKRRNFNSPFKAKGAIAAIKGQRTITEMTAKHKLHATQINLWKQQRIDAAEGVFENGSARKAKPIDTDEPVGTKNSAELETPSIKGSLGCQQAVRRKPDASELLL